MQALLPGNAGLLSPNAANLISNATAVQAGPTLRTTNATLAFIVASSAQVGRRRRRHLKKRASCMLSQLAECWQNAIRSVALLRLSCISNVTAHQGRYLKHVSHVMFACTWLHY
jgi:hypothetical protein